MKNPLKGLDKSISPKKAAAGAALGIGAVVGAAALDALLALLSDGSALTLILSAAGVSLPYVGLIVTLCAALAKVGMNAWKHRK